MKILWVNPSFLDYRIPVYKKLNELSDGGFFIIFSKKRVPERVFKKIKNAIGDHAIGLPDEVVFSIPAKGDFANTDLRIPFQRGLYKAISKVDADIIIGEGFFQWTPVALMTGFLRRKKFLIAYERTAHTERNCPKWRTLYRKVITRFVEGYLVNGRLTKEYLIQLGVNEKKIFIGGMSADSENLITGLSSITTSEQEIIKLSISLNKGLIYLYIGQINQRKGVVCLLNAWRKHIEKYPDDNLVVIGTGPLYNLYVKEFSSYSSIKLLGGVDYDKVYGYYAIADVFVIPTLEDNWSLVVPEAMACGLPIACSIYNGCYPELVRDGINGKLFDPLNEFNVIETLEYFHHQDIKIMGEESMKIEKGYNATAVADNIYNSCKRLYVS